MSLTDKVLKKFSKDEAIQSFKDVDIFGSNKAWLSTGSPRLESDLDILGFPVGIVEISGESGSGKTTMSLHAMKSFQEQFGEVGVATILSTERRDNKPYAKALGVDVDNIIVANCRSIEDVFNKVAQIVDQTCEVFEAEGNKEKPKFCFFWDSLGASISEQEKLKMQESADDDSPEDQGKAAMASAARAVKRGLRAVQNKVYDYDIWFIIINHVYDNIGGVGKSSYGGKGIEFMPNLRIRVVRTGFTKYSEIKKGQEGYFEIIKSDFNNYREKVPFEIALGKGFILTKYDLEYALEKGIITKKGANGYSFMDGKLEWKSRGEFIDLHHTNNPFIKILMKKVTQAYHQDVLDRRKERDELNSKSM